MAVRPADVFREQRSHRQGAYLGTQVQLVKRRSLRGAVSLTACVLLTVGAMLACRRQALPGDELLIGRVTPLDPTQEAAATAGTPLAQIFETPTPVPTRPVAGTPTPDPTRPSQAQPGPRTYVVQAGDTLGEISQAYGVSIEDLMSANELTEADILFVDQVLAIPEVVLEVGPAIKIIPDSELVFGPGVVNFDVLATVDRHGGYLATYVETDEQDVTRRGADIVRLVAQRYSVNPRLLLALLEHRSGWLQNPAPDAQTLIYPMGQIEAGREGLLRQLSWTADMLNFGFYGWRHETLSTVGFPDGSLLAVGPGLNAGTVALQFLFGRHFDQAAWQALVRPGGFEATYAALFGNAFAYTVDPLVPGQLAQPLLAWPWDSAHTWYFTGGPHGGWGDGSAWAALDFAPPDEQEGCYTSEAWVRTAAPGLIIRSSEGAVIQDLDGDGFEQTGWVLFYMHVASQNRIRVGQYLQQGDAIGHASCEGGFSSGTHLHFARRYNGVWIAADDPALPLTLSGWTVVSAGRAYDGWLVKGEVALEAYGSRDETNAIVLSGE